MAHYIRNNNNIKNLYFNIKTDIHIFKIADNHKKNNYSICVFFLGQTK